MTEAPTTAELLDLAAKTASNEELRAIRQDALHLALAFVKQGFRLRSDGLTGEEEVINLANRLVSFVLNGKLVKDQPEEVR